MHPTFPKGFQGDSTRAQYLVSSNLTTAIDTHVYWNNFLRFDVINVYSNIYTLDEWYVSHILHGTGLRDT